MTGVIPIHVVSSDAVRHHTTGSLRLEALPPLSLYIHLPWCIKKCPYCDFNSHEASADTASIESAYVDALMVDLEGALPLIWGRTVRSIFIGGGTPSLFSPKAIDALLGGVRARLRLEADCEITMEANPGTFEIDRFRAFASAGVTRLSIGVQSFNDVHLKAIGRVHDGEQARAAVAEAAQAFKTFNIDLMYALPGQTMADLQRDLDVALSFAPPHISIYHLTIEPNTLFAKYPPQALPEDDLAYDMLDAITVRTASAGLGRYEISAFAQHGHRCWHNLNYWQFGDYLGIGAGAHSKLSFAQRIVRQTRLRDPGRYRSAAQSGQSVVAQDLQIERVDLPLEFMMNALRLTEGFTLSQYLERTGMPISSIRAQLDAAQGKGLIEQTLHHVKPTAMGLDFLNDLTGYFLPE